MHEWEDYYKLLQVDFLAETEIIQSAYKKLAKKYHPDINKSSVAIDIMKHINIAYDTLLDESKRSQYDIKWLERQGYNNTQKYRTISTINEIYAAQAKSVLNQYFNSIFNKNYVEAYGYISENDKKYISLSEFVKWQDTVSKVFQLDFFECEALKCYRKKVLNGTSFEEVIEFDVRVIEKNLVMDRIEEDELTKQTVYENNKWSVYIGYMMLTPLIERFERLSNLTGNKKRIILKENLKTDLITGFLNKKGFAQKAGLEIERYKRYGNIFSVIVFQVVYKNEAPRNISAADKHEILKEISFLINKSIRVLDIPCRWNNKSFVILLPETDLKSTQFVIRKIKSIINRKSTHTESYHVEMTGMENAYKSVKSLYEGINNYLMPK